MKTPVMLLAAICFLAACKKDSILASKPDTKPNSSLIMAGQSLSALSSHKHNPDPKSKSSKFKTTAYDTIPDQTVLRLRLAKDSINYDETLFMFNHTAGTAYDPNYDSPYMSGYGLESLASLSSDDHDLVVNTIPYQPGLPVRLDVGATGDGSFALQISYLSASMPADIQVFIKDRYLKDSADVRTGPYKFNIVKSDTASYGASRFSIVFRNQTH
ncbi:MAG: hypothetical protein JSU01_09540 [Bacteroidetes bacterium]|nr:hypothetical protein [Bacteroidota bacterium]